ncbi:hypothetical protein SKAU_G00065960 [Synaphobranchus kaupii]|uniref:Uncharacterized protein n=1 Tax=Synaphobranchus kaupii TaxID=118154 RepID=A0A9Q1G698_SYNKA|nr:hypothetical protein SKAU_G00065960 [Synaphobranchus kaupii]
MKLVSLSRGTRGGTQSKQLSAESREPGAGGTFISDTAVPRLKSCPDDNNLDDAGRRQLSQSHLATGLDTKQRGSSRASQGPGIGVMDRRGNTNEERPRCLRGKIVGIEAGGRFGILSPRGYGSIRGYQPLLTCPDLHSEGSAVVGN